MRKEMVLIAACLLAATQAQAACFEPRPPVRDLNLKPPKPPAEPGCAALRVCQQAEIDVYDAAIRRYQTETQLFEPRAREYVRQPQQYVDAALKYAKCEIGELDGGL